MSRSVLCKRLSLMLALMAGLMAAGAVAAAPPEGIPPSSGGASGTAAHLLERMPLLFVPEPVSSDGAVGYAVRGREASVWLSGSGLSYRLHPASGSDSAADAWVVALDLVGASPGRPVGYEPLPTRVSYFKGPEDQWRTGLPSFGSVVYREPWPGVDLVVAGTGGELKSSFVVRPGADPGLIRLAYRGASAVQLEPDGSLLIDTPVGSIREQAPVAYQEVDGLRVGVDVAFELEPAAEHGSQAYVFRVGAYDRGRELVVDPVTLVYCGYLGGAGWEFGDDIAVDADGNTYVAGWTSSAEASFPVAVGPDLSYNGGNHDVFVAKINAGGTALDYCGYIGGSEDDGGGFLAIDADGSAYVSGYTWSTEASFPVTVGPDLSYNGGRDAFVAKVNATGTSLDYCGYIGGGSEDYSYGVGVDAAGNAYVSGYTYSDQASFPVTVGPDLSYNGSGDAFVTKVNAVGNALSYCGYVGGSESDLGFGIAVNAAGNAFLTGYAASDESTFPVTIGPDLSYNGGDRDAFVAKVAAAGTALDYCGYIGGSQEDWGWAIALDAGGTHAHVTGHSSSSEATFPVTVGPDLSYNGGARDAFVAKVNAAGSALAYCGYVGGSGSDTGYGIAVDVGGNAYLTGETSSSAASFPVTLGPDLSYNGGAWDAFVARVRATGAAMDYCGYIGGSDGDFGYGVAVDSWGNAFVTGETSSTEATFPVTLGPDLSYNGGFNDGFVAKVSSGGLPFFADGFESGDTSAWSVTVP
ncbi:MAG TPA: SBBP repeat-containing protein [Thermoanaerobaculales bacterium]|nr:SBBP repeat-containing protein [Thermoanaerobaculales bacterium]HQN97753.1 SBBP repeat-containing protein [Thermoanaerobaculales bacterium]